MGLGAPTPTLETLSAALIGSRPGKTLSRIFDSGGSLPVVGGVTGVQFSLLVRALLKGGRGPLLVLVPGEEEAEAVVEDLRLLGEESASLLYLEPGTEAAGDRARVVATLGSRPQRTCLVASVRAAVEPLPSTDTVRGAALEVRVGGELERDEFTARLRAAGGEREAVVDRPGTYSVRGDLVDLFPRDRDRPLRIEFMEDTVEAIRAFDPASQLSVEILDAVSLSLLPADDLESGDGLARHLEGSWTVVARDAASLDEHLATHLSRYDAGEARRRSACWRELTELATLLCSRLKAPAAEALNLGGQVIAPSGTSFETAVETLERVTRGKAVTFLAFDSEPEKDRFFLLLEEQREKLPEVEKILERPVLTTVGRLSEGFHSPFLGIAALNHQELFATVVRRRRVRDEEPVASEAIESFLDLSEGDHVVHLVHGIARFVGLRRVEKGGAEQDFLVLEFRDAVQLHVPASKIDLVQKYVGGRGDAPEPSRLGGAGWSKRKEAVQQAVTDMAAELLELHAIRARKAGIRHPPDTPWQQEFEAAFPYRPTPDQLLAVEAIKKDLESPRPMDRLICGDVGYGKTEVAMRAAFKVVMGNRQVAVLVPTTVLAQQHWETFRERMKDYPVVIEALSRFRTKAEQKRVLEALAAGTVDIVIGTHRLVQGDVALKNLGLLIIDEEQRFGVVHKDRLRRLRANVDVLVMSATPIPRTLHQAILGIRDISPLGQAPQGRRQIRTEVIPKDDGVIRSAILRELDREGQIFFVHNRVQTIHKVADRLGKLVPEARIVIGHGQMPERALERTMLAFLERKADILVATTIIESGLDIPTVNTIFVDQADHYGLSDLHQLRGRVGRYHLQAYAYFLIHGDTAVSAIAEKRLRAIEEFDRLGAGFQIAMRDMEIRGAGNILGPEQSGHIAAVGYEMYCRLVDAAVKRLRNEPVEMPEEVELNLDFDAYVPEDYIPEKKLRIEVYRKLGRAMTDEAFAAVELELRDRFGPPPRMMREFVIVARIRALCERRRLQRLEIMPGEGILITARRLKKLLDVLRPPGEGIRILGGRSVLVVHPAPFESPGPLLEILQRCLGSESEAGVPAPSVTISDGGTSS